MQDAKVNPKPQDHVSFRIAVNPKAAKAAEKVGGAAAQHAGTLRLFMNSLLSSQCAWTHLGAA